ncbi:MAG: malto-oligosyltrehalose synthase [Armatimonadetes bacterium]|nr:malto-oligosyltrehalose synthase [Armatimonadota bacterium]
MNATYRLQLRPGFGFAEVRTLLPYLRRLGISHLYLSPITEARPGSLHGYDVVDHSRIREELGGAQGFSDLQQEARALGLALILDFVPNHADAGPTSFRWQDVLAYGPHSPYARYFDVQWDPLKPELKGKILLPFLGRPYGDALDGGEITLAYHGGRFYAAYHAHRFALSPATYADILDAARPLAREEAIDLAETVRAYRLLSPSQREALEALRPRLEDLAARIPLDRVLEQFTGERLHALLDQQFWRLAHWKTAGHEINYRRFFYVNELVALRVEDNDVFAEIHGLMGALVAEDGVEGVRVDHVDGLFDPHTYLERLRRVGARRIWVEKILAPDEILPEAWDVEGTTGYDFLNDAMGVLTWPGGEIPLDQIYRRFVPRTPPYPVEVYRSKLLVMRHHLAGELFRLAYDLDRISEADYHTRDFSFEALREAIAEVVAALPRYRTYLPHDRDQAMEVLRVAIHQGRQRHPAGEPSIFEFILRVLLGEVRPDLREAAMVWTGRFQQYASVVMAKGVEDTAFYRYFRLAALNEVGGDPRRFALPAEAFHSRARFRSLRRPHTLLTTATHDHKRGEDTRMRLIALAELSEAWRRTLRLLAPLVRRYGGERGPSPADMYLFFQTLAALWEGSHRGDLADRLLAYMHKAAREAKLHTSWLNPDPDYEAAVERFVRGVMDDPRLIRWLGPLARDLARYGFINGLTQVVLKITSPGVPDFYQGSEFLDLSLVDPDNRRPVDFQCRRLVLDEIEPLIQEPDAQVLQRMLAAGDERLKLYCIARLLRLRQQQPGPFRGSYQPLAVQGPGAEHFLAYAREGEAHVVLVVVPRFPATMDARRGFTSARVLLPAALVREAPTEVLSGRVLHVPEHLDPTGLPLPWAVFLTRRSVD